MVETESLTFVKFGQILDISSESAKSAFKMFKECTIPKVTSSSGASSVSILAFVCVFCFVIEGPRIVLRVLKSMKEWKRKK